MQLELFIRRKRKQLMAYALSDVRQWSIVRDRCQATLRRLAQLLREKLLTAAEKKIRQWRKYTKHFNRRYTKGMSKLIRTVNRKVDSSKITSFNHIHHYSEIIKILEKLEAAHTLRHHSLLSEIITMVSRETIEKLTTSAAPSKFTQNKVIKKNGYRYLGLILRKVVRRRTLILFKWYQNHTKLMRHANFVGKLMETSMIQRA